MQIEVKAYNMLLNAINNGKEDRKIRDSIVSLKKQEILIARRGCSVR